jgi:hypothetical protein
VLIPKRVAAAALPAVFLGVERLLEARGFHSVMRSEMVDGRRFWRWDRDRQWALDRVEALYRVHRPEDPAISLIAMLRLTPERELTMDGFPTYFLAGRPDMYDFPLFTALRLRRPERLAAYVVEETERVLPWFDRYATPEKCLVGLQSPQRNGVGVGTPVHAQAIAVLEAAREHYRK